MPFIVGALLADMKTSQTVGLLEVTCRFQEILNSIQTFVANWALNNFVARDAGLDHHSWNSLQPAEMKFETPTLRTYFQKCPRLRVGELMGLLG
jgi:hypothetical protein